MKNIVILGAGTGGTIMANRLHHRLDSDWRITIVDRDLRHIYQPGLLFLPFGGYRREELIRDRALFLPAGVQLRLEEVDLVDTAASRVRFADGSSLAYDFLIIATGARIAPETTEGLTSEGWRNSIFDFYTIDGAAALGAKLDSWPGGRMLVNIVEMPIKCPVAPLELLFLADAFFTNRGLRDRVELVFATPLDGAFTKPRASAVLAGLLEKKGIKIEPNFNASSVDGGKRELRSYDDRVLPYDLLVTIPQHQGADLIVKSGLGDGSGFVPTDKHTLRSKNFSNIFALGDATDLPSSKAGSVAHFQAEVLTENILAAIEDRPMSASFDGHSICFIETGHEKAALIDFNYDTEPLPGRFPLPGIGPFALLEENYVNHWGKLGFRWAYWNMLLRGRDLPLDHQLMLAGKWR